MGNRSACLCDRFRARNVWALIASGHSQPLASRKLTPRKGCGVIRVSPSWRPRHRVAGLRSMVCRRCDRTKVRDLGYFRRQARRRVSVVTDGLLAGRFEVCGLDDNMLEHRDEILTLDHKFGHWCLSSWMIPMPRPPSTAVEGGIVRAFARIKMFEELMINVRKAVTSIIRLLQAYSAISDKFKITQG